MRTVRRLLYRDIVASVLFVAFAFQSLYFFFGLVDALESVGGRGDNLWLALRAAALQMPNDFYELFPIAVLIGTIYSLARMAQGSEFTILRTGGLGPGMALRLLAGLGLAFALLTFVVGDFVAPAAERQSVLIKAERDGGIKVGGAGAWLKERRNTAQGERSFSVNVAGAQSAGRLSGVRIYEFDDQGRMVSRIQAKQARVPDAAGSAQAADRKGGPDPDQSDNPAMTNWVLESAEVTRWPQAVSANRSAVAVSQHAQLIWPSTLTANVVSAAVLPLSSMSTLELWRYSQHLSGQEQASQTQQIRFWRKALYPLACLVMVALALPFAYLHARAGGVSLKVFGGVMLGISFVLLSNLAGHMGMLRGWTPWVAAAAPSLLYLLLSMAAFAWLVRYR
jgi:lipopolysaccharide export system permease protein